MKLWIGAEMDEEVSDAYRQARRLVEPAVNAKLSDVKLGSPYEKWAFIGIVMSDEGFYKEVAKKDARRKVLEFRLKIDHDAFRRGTDKARAALMLKALERSVDGMSGLGVSDEDRARLRSILADVEREISGKAANRKH
jgi:hypothetical protein